MYHSEWSEHCRGGVILRKISLVLALIFLSCSSCTQRAGKGIDDKARIDQALAHYHEGDVEAGISLLRTWVDSTQYKPTHDEAYELIVAWLLQLNRREQAKQVAAFFLARHPKSEHSKRIIQLFDQEPSPPPTKDVPKEPEPEIHDQQQEQNTETEEEEELLFDMEDMAPQPVDAKTLGILLPLTGPFAPFGKKALGAMSIALDIPLELVDGNINVVKKNDISIVLADSKGDPDQASAMVDLLVKTHHVALIVGDIINESSVRAARRSSMYGLPMLSLSRHPQLFSYPGIFVFNSSQSRQISKLVDYAMDRQGHKRFAILYPRHNYGMSMSTMFFDEVIKRGGSITAIEAYDSHETTFADAVKKMTGTYYLRDRPEFNECQKDPKDLTVEKCLENIPPIVDFEALFVPEFGKLAMVIPALERENMLVTNSAAEKQSFVLATKIGDPQYVQLLGTSSWNDPATIGKISTRINGAYFVDTVSFEHSDELKRFSERFFVENGSTPTTLEVFAHDATKLAVNILANNTDENATRETFKEKLLATHSGVGLLKDISFSKNGELASSEIGFQIANGAIAAVD